jgi:hypothetical protein
MVLKNNEEIGGFLEESKFRRLFTSKNPYIPICTILSMVLILKTWVTNLLK